jgi:energy-coupling factor transporter ATP-binding protein EcfA2
MKQPDAKAEHRIVMWGPPGSGKTTFLAALSIALIDRDQDWHLLARDPDSADALARLTSTLIEDRAFPPRTPDVEHHHWSLVGRPERPGRLSRFRKQREDYVEVALDVVDMPGESSAPRALGLDVQEEMVTELARSRGIVVFIDPIREAEVGDAFGHVYGVLAQLSQRAAEPGLSGGRLPHYVAVCLTKFDNLRVQASAQRLHLTSYDPDDPYGFPRVHDEEARELIVALSEVSNSGYATVLMSSLEKYFLPARVRYFVTSAIGFYTAPDRQPFDPADFQNRIQDRDHDRIRGPVHPINVAEPLLWLCQELAEA